VEGGRDPLFKSLVGRKGRMWSVFLSDLKAAFTFNKTTLTLKVVNTMYTTNFECYEHKTQLKPKS
jgi:hypothetical protein